MKTKNFFSLKRSLDFMLSLIGLLAVSPILIPVIFLVWCQDRHSPFYVAERVGKDFTTFRMVKIRSMVKNADSTGVDSTSANDSRITPVGRFIRKYKLDELTQLWNVLKGDMSLVGPRPNVRRETDLYTREEQELLTIKPGMTDFASIVFSDEGDILLGQQHPDIAYNQLIRPGKSKLGLTYLQTRSLYVDFQIVFITGISIFSRQYALLLISKLLTKLEVSSELIELSMRKSLLVPMPPPGREEIVTSRDLIEGAID